MNPYTHIKKQDRQVYAALEGEEARQAEGLELIPSENYVSLAVREANFSILTNKYSEGYPGKRYYGGQKYTDIVENIARERAKKLFGAQYANVQTLGGANANIAMYFALLQPGDTVLGMDLSHGGHLTHGHPVTYLTKIFKFVRYKMKDADTGEIDYDEMRAVALREKPKIVLAGFSAYPRELDYAQFVSIARSVGAYAVMDIAHIAGLIAGHAVKNPFDYGFDIMTSTTHKTLRGPRGGLILTRESEELAKKIDRMVFPGLQGGPHMNNIAAKAVAFGEALKPSFKMYVKQILKNAKAMEGVFKAANIRLITGGTKGISGKEASTRLENAGIIVNMNTIPHDPRSPMDPSGIRFGTPAITTRGFKEKESARVAELMVETLHKRTDQKALKKIHVEVKSLCKRFPIPKSFA
ncbi:MAG: serine hydroxymethyltransferase [Candidatus Kaiserbacteria bacterium GW2011_GWB1_52_6]|uniref:Serine hydroxymethyltransferase n=1 Tax=Candidatus Kaiserbacteria bacterium GW2011_GWB1_52_6 TaxID=1618674 RepID=A0A0G1X6R6_9BACT|nr:MAG: serine hydroxymethyltransferase [Candidatus Kaiserbacteria bacterium GW2011_GWB1_52_6]